MKRLVWRFRFLMACTVLCLLGIENAQLERAQAAINWDADAATNWWFDPVNWSREGTLFGDLLPPSTDSGDALGFTDAQINIGWNASGEGVVYDPANDPNFDAASSLMYPTGSSATPFVGSDYGPEHIYRLYIGRNVTDGLTNKLTIKSGDLIIASTFVVGRSGSTLGNENLGIIVQEGGSLRSPVISMDIGQAETSGWGNGTYDYRGGILEIDIEGTNGIRLAHGGGNDRAGGKGTFIVHNPATAGHVRTWRYQSASARGEVDAIMNAGDPDGIITGVATTQFHYENGGTRPIQVGQSLSINNGFQDDTQGTVSSRLDLVLNEAACAGSGCVPNDLGLFDVNFDLGFGDNGGIVTGSGEFGGTFSNADGSSVYTEGSTLSAVFGGTRYDWTISYSGDVSWSNADDSVVGAISGAGTGVDVVLMGLGSEALAMDFPGDFDGNLSVGNGDLTLLLDGWGGAPAPEWVTNPPVSVGNTSLTELLDNWGNNYASGVAAAAVPEPGSLMLLSAVMLTLIGIERGSNRARSVRL